MGLAGLENEQLYAISGLGTISGHPTYLNFQISLNTFKAQNNLICDGKKSINTNLLSLPFLIPTLVIKGVELFFVLVFKINLELLRQHINRTKELLSSPLSSIISSLPGNKQGK